MAPPAAGGISSCLAQPFPPTATAVQSEPGSLLEQQPLCAERHVPTAKRPTCPGAGPLQGVGWTAWGGYGLTLFFQLPQVPGLAFLLRLSPLQRPERKCVGRT